MKKTIIILLSFLFLATAILPAYAAPAQLDYSKLKQIILTGIDKCVQALNTIESKIASNSYLDEETKQEINAALEKMESNLLSYKSKVEAANTLTELQAINQQIIQYLKDNKDVIKQNITAAITELAEEATQKAEELKQKIAQALTLLKVTCPEQKTTISTLESQLVQLESEIAILKSAIQTKNTTTMKQEIQEITQLSKDIVNNLKIIEESCF